MSTCRRRTSTTAATATTARGATGYLKRIRYGNRRQLLDPPRPPATL